MFLLLSESQNIYKLSVVSILTTGGPRPLLVEYLPWYTEQERHRHDVRPGLTGWAQIHGRNTVNWAERFALDVEYVRSITLKKDISIIFLTVMKVLKKEDVAEDTRVTEGNFATIRMMEMNREAEVKK